MPTKGSPQISIRIPPGDLDDWMRAQEQNRGMRRQEFIRFVLERAMASDGHKSVARPIPTKGPRGAAGQTKVRHALSCTCAICKPPKRT